MRVCVPLLSSDVCTPSAKDVHLAAHFGLADRFAVVDSVSGEILDECDISGYCPGPCHCPLPNLADGDVDALAGRSMGFRLMQLSRRAKLPVLAVQAQTLGELRNEMHSQSPALPMSVGKCLSVNHRKTAAGKS